MVINGFENNNFVSRLEKVLIPAGIKDNNKLDIKKEIEKWKYFDGVFLVVDLVSYYSMHEYFNPNSNDRDEFLSFLFAAIEQSDLPIQVKEIFVNTFIASRNTIELSSDFSKLIDCIKENGLLEEWSEYQKEGWEELCKLYNEAAAQEEKYQKVRKKYKGISALSNAKLKEFNSIQYDDILFQGTGEDIRREFLSMLTRTYEVDKTGIIAKVNSDKMVLKRLKK